MDLYPELVLLLSNAGNLVLGPLIDPLQVREQGGALEWTGRLLKQVREEEAMEGTKEQTVFPY